MSQRRPRNTRTLKSSRPRYAQHLYCSHSQSATRRRSTRWMSASTTAPNKAGKSPWTTKPETKSAVKRNISALMIMFVSSVYTETGISQDHTSTPCAFP
jgi:hypothetical protein